MRVDEGQEVGLCVSQLHHRASSNVDREPRKMLIGDGKRYVDPEIVALTPVKSGTWPNF
jgi:hypothetical protein